VLSILEFCQYAGISRSFYYSLQRTHKGPAETRIGARVLIARATADKWLKSHEMSSDAREVAA
jgi:predicted DNA-binding transcriptional regulator AlpA